ncbi:uncharacterized protein LOC126836539 [Adelges cooleyi]|uniref:uncharacterized protein LOC126836539 n=1 Tax=Adelges cooleyi TaxID=133065 RepID=UPI002180967C|nr:uncharacterized protein LOC126836539 [Adelges cooleyi]
MYFKISLLFCALYFFTAVRTIGLSEQQINLCVQLSMKYNKIPTTAVADNKTMPELLIHLASVEKESDDWEEKSLTTLEVRIFVGLFTIKDQKGDHDGLLTYAELVSLINNDLTLVPDVKENIKNEFNNGDSINAQKFLAAILKHKPEVRKRLAVKPNLTLPFIYAKC